ncbi:MFS general substrate transporter [Dothidotthia symphoricarpi CBS 119687]|uniref:MFS general substrate transporter n=1 Tax=Dothidotthia symphoricarpi CBS 119687 TaxID=1392245 RepID=A0A6A6AEJ2_9PLEO|nr:MFS general substrate transporter [Dothidotthia symphoricarpi CBS 119687]KAF2129723.1 MFS general substrate transporter [Dothidotthia symphoricarpi CBS 119687]
MPRSNNPSDTEKSSADESPGVKPLRNYSRTQWTLVLVAIYCSQFLYGLDNTIVADIQGAVVNDFGEIGKLGWLGIGFPLGSVATILTFGKAYGIFDLKWLYIGSMVMFTAGSALCGAAPNMISLIIGRGVLGFRRMILTSLHSVLNLISVNTSMRERSVYIGMSGVVWGAGCILGPIIGGSFAESSATWRWAFYLNLVLFAVFSPVLLFVLKPYSFQPDIPFAQKLKSIDWVGVVLNAAVYTIFVVIFTVAGVEWAWNDNRTIAMFVVFGAVFVAFIASQLFRIGTTKVNRLFPGDFLRNRTLVLLYICQACAATSLFVPIYYIPVFFQFVFGDSAIEAAVRLLPVICIGVAANMLQGILLPRLGYYMPWFLVASIFSVIAGALFYAAVDMTTTAGSIYGYSILLGLGAGLSQQGAYSVAPTQVSPDRVPDAVGFINTAQIGANVIALTITSSIFQNVGFRRVSDALSGLGFSAVEIRGALAGQRSAVYSQVTPEVRQHITEAILRTINDEYILVIAAGILGVVASLMMNRGKLQMEVATGG